MKYPRLKRLLAAALACCLLTGCTLTERLGVATSSEDSAETVVENHGAGYFGLAYYTGEKINPVLSTSDMNRPLLDALYEGLFYLDNNFQPQLMLCESWEGDGISFTFHIKPGVTFWSGDALTADDVVYTLNTVKANETSPYYSRMADVKSVYAEDDNTVGVVLSSANMDFPRLMDIPIFQAGTEDETFSGGTGAYQPNYVDGAWWLSPYAGWHGGAVDTFQKITLVNTTRSDAVMHSFETGDISLVRTERISSEPITISGSVDLHQIPTTCLHYLGFGKVGPCSLPAVRQAISAAIARKDICGTQLQTFADPAVLPVNPQPKAPATSVEANRDNATALLASAGLIDSNGDGTIDYDNGAGRANFAPTILVNSENTFKVSAAQAVADALLVLGIRATVEAVPFEEYTARLASGNFEIFYGETRMTPDFDLRSLIATGGALNYGQYSNIDTDYLIEQARALGTDEAKQTLYTQLLNEMPIVPIAFIRDQVAVRSKLINGFNPSPNWLFHGVGGWRAN
ncbi:MAG: ABC transporter substrate-binding protein [Butyricicoccus sp.]|nr:ABC transporter substrate-binding protein [Butyricicoccus sp.]